ERLMIERRDHPVADNVVDEWRAHAAGITEIARLDRRRPVRQDLRAGVAGVALEVYGDVDLELAQQARDLAVVLAAHVVELIERRDQPLPRCALVVDTERYGDDLELAAVVALEQLGHQERGGVRLEVGREIGDADLVVAPGLAGPQRWRQ